jgi:hypothetical protein
MSLRGAGKPCGTEIDGTRQLLAYAHHVNLLGENKDTIKKTQKL